ncbi:MAG: hypothetical protein JJ974_00670 [Phycisphaerales bacterium]|nr:hypothetical protein [Phycisphaerales bacterium]
MKKTTALTLAALTALSSAAIAGEEEGIILGDANSTATFSSNGQFEWSVDGTDHLYDQSFYFRRAGDNQEFNIGSLEVLGVAVNDTNTFTDDRDDSINTLYSDGNGLEIETLFTLRGGSEGSGISSLAEQISITNTSTSTMFISFFQYVDFDLGGDASDDWGQIVDGNTALQYDDEFALSETVVTPQPTLFQMDDEGTMYDIFNDDGVDDLNGNDSYQGDVAWAFQWNIELGAGDSFLISKNKTLGVPTPGSLALLASAGLVATRRRRA